jgi:5-methylcytosine-specific restriction endonuclease McrA
MSVRNASRRMASAPPGTVPPAGMILQLGHQAGTPVITSTALGAEMSVTWSLSTPWPNHPALMPPEPREAGGDPYAPRAYTPEPDLPARQPSARPPRRPAHPSPTPPHRTGTVHTPRLTGPKPAHQAPRHDLPWPDSFDDWMIDITRRRTLRLNAGARRRGVVGSVRAVELAHILEESRDGHGRWLCAICREPVTLNDLSFDHVIALADGGEHAAHNLAPAHRKCNEEKGSERAQERAGARDRWLDEWAASHSGRVPRGATRHHGNVPVARLHDWRAN